MAEFNIIYIYILSNPLREISSTGKRYLSQVKACPVKCLLVLYLTGGCPQFKGGNYYAGKLLYSPVYLVFYRIPRCVGLLESVFRAIVNRSKVYPPLAGLSAVFLVHRLCGGVADWAADHLMTASFTGERIQGLRMTPIHKLL